MFAENVAGRERSIRDALRLQTRDVHEQLHQHAHFVALFAGSIAPPQYRALMRAFHGFYAPLERAIERATAQLPATEHGFVYEKRLAYLEQDLAHLGLAPQHIRQNPQCPHLAEIVTPASLGGVLYVIEGSTLGAAQIDRAAQRILSAQSPEGRQFWAWSRAHNKERWAAINAYLMHLERSGASLEAIIDGARDTFAALAAWLAPLDQPMGIAKGALR